MPNIKNIFNNHNILSICKQRVRLFCLILCICSNFGFPRCTPPSENNPAPAADQVVNLTDMKNRISNLENHNAKLALELKIANDETELLKNKLGNLGKENIALQKKHDEINKKYDKLQEEHDDLKKIHSGCTRGGYGYYMGSTGGNNNSELATLKTEMNRVESNYKALQVIHHTLEQNFKSRNNEISSLSAEKDTLVQQNKAWEKKNEALKNKIEKSEDDLSAQAKEIEELKTKLAEAQNKYATAIEKLKAEHDKSLAEKVKEIQELNGKLIAEQAACNNSIADLNKEKQDSESKLEKLENTITELNKTLPSKNQNDQGAQTTVENTEESGFEEQKETCQETIENKNVDKTNLISSIAKDLKILENKVKNETREKLKENISSHVYAMLHGKIESYIEARTKDTSKNDPNNKEVIHKVMSEISKILQKNKLVDWATQGIISELHQDIVDTKQFSDLQDDTKSLILKNCEDVCKTKNFYLCISDHLRRHKNISYACINSIIQSLNTKLGPLICTHVNTCLSYSNGSDGNIKKTSSTFKEKFIEKLKDKIAKYRKTAQEVPRVLVTKSEVQELKLYQKGIYNKLNVKISTKNVVKEINDLIVQQIFDILLDRGPCLWEHITQEVRFDAKIYEKLLNDIWKRCLGTYCLKEEFIENTFTELKKEIESRNENLTK